MRQEPFATPECSGDCDKPILRLYISHGEPQMAAPPHSVPQNAQGQRCPQIVRIEAGCKQGLPTLAIAQFPVDRTGLLIEGFHRVNLKAGGGNSSYYERRCFYRGGRGGTWVPLGVTHLRGTCQGTKKFFSRGLSPAFHS